MLRTMIEIDRDRCNGCGACAEACHEGAIGMVDGKAMLLRDDYCDGLGACLPACPVDALSLIEREAAPFNEAAVAQRMAGAKSLPAASDLECGCPGTQVRSLEHSSFQEAQVPRDVCPPKRSALAQWPVQLRLVPIDAPYFDGARLLVAADCSAYAHPAFHCEFMAGRVTVIGCPKLDEADYAGKLIEIVRRNNVKSVTVVRMEVPCCGGIERAVQQAMKDCGKTIPWRSVTLSLKGELLEEF